MLEGFADDLVYLLILVSSFSCALCVKRLQTHRDLVAAAIGVFAVVVVCRWHFLYSFGVVCGNLVFYRVATWRTLPHCSFLFTFSYLAFVRCAHFFHLPRPSPHANAVQLLMTLRVVGLAFEIADARAVAELRRKSSAGGKSIPEEHRVIPPPTSLQAFAYLYNFAGLFTGPYYSYLLHVDMVSSRSLARIPIWPEVLPRLTRLLLFIPLLLFVAHYFPLAAMHTDEFYTSHGFLTRFLFMCPVFVFLRMRVYCAWMLSEAACIANGIGVYPEATKPKSGVGPTRLAGASDDRDGDVQWSVEAIRNLDIGDVEMSDGFRSGMRAWNRSVQFWLATYIYKRSSKTIRMPLTMLVSAFWHGIHPGYYLSFLTIPLCTYAEDLVYSIVPVDQSGRRPRWFEISWWFIRTRGFEYMAMGFLLLSFESTVRFWASIGFVLHGTIIVVIVAAHLYKRVVGGEQQGRKEKKTQ